jgi:hypothetical protein
MSDQFVSLPGDVLGASQKYDTSNLLATVTRFAAGNNAASLGNTLERDVDLRFSSLQSISFSDATSYFAAIGLKTQALDSAIADLANGEPETLHQALQQGNNAGQLQLLAVNDASRLVELDEAGEAHPLWSKVEGCLLLRLGYNTDAQPGYGYYAASLPGDSRRQIKITWQSLIDAGVSAAIAILPAAKPIDLDRVANAKHIIDQARITIANALTDLLDALGLPTPDANQQPAAASVAEQAVS